jgi:excisionase family DNA binding protein
MSESLAGHISGTKKAKTIAGAYSIDMVAEVICVHRSTVERLLESRTLGFYQVGRRRVIGQTHLNEYLAQVEREPMTESHRR